MEQTQGTKRAVEAVMNHRHILDLFPNVTREPSEEAIVHLGRVLKDTWSCKLRRDLPERNCGCVLCRRGYRRPVGL
jgi:hypothetical protein